MKMIFYDRKSIEKGSQSNHKQSLSLKLTFILSLKLTFILSLKLKLRISFHRFVFLQLSETESQDLPPFPDPKDVPAGGGAPDTGPILPVPKGIRPTLAKYRY
jgi:hypothetical protein